MGVSGDVIPEGECWQLLASVSVGRLALSIRALPAIVPVQYYLEGRKLAVCLGHREFPWRSLNGVVAFAADEIDPIARSGWLVQVQGRAMIPSQRTIGTDCGWPAQAQIVQIEPVLISGYRMGLCPFIESLLDGQAVIDSEV